MKTNKTKEVKKVFEPWAPEQKKQLEHSLAQIEIQKINKESELETLEQGQEDLDDEVEWQIADAKAKQKAANLNLERCLFNKINKLTQKDVIFKIDEAKIEVDRLGRNIKAMHKQIEAGKLVPPKEKKKDEVSSLPE